VRSAVHCRILHELNCHTPHTANCTPHRDAHQN
jgi:hypothetical protein